jgi:nitrite reductase (cytochrome c-552)
MLDFVEAENSTGFHAPEEAERVLAESIDYARQGQLALRGASVPGLKTAELVKPVPTHAPKQQ